MTELAGEVGDGMMTHPTNTAPSFLREFTRPHIARGAERIGRDGARVALMAGGLVITGADDEAVAAQREHVRELLTFLYSTPAYWRTLELFGWDDVGPRLHAFTREGRWNEMTGIIDDSMLAALIPQGRYDEIADVLVAWYGELASLVTFPVPPDPAQDGAATEVIAALRGSA
jgi:alkanesulfonate monooxygenase SsuD/methylene tetrahydromethanopterin reductase-like flavin-dependent oxidoreductase (luciferase family)